jgi:TolA-binding protein
MLKKTISILFLLVVFCLLLLTVQAITAQDTESAARMADKDGIQSIGEQKKIIIGYIECANSVSAQASFDKIIADYGNNELIVPAVYDIAEKYREKAQYKSAVSAYKYVVDNFPANQQAVWAQRGMAVSYIALGKLEDAQAELDNLKNNYSADPNIAEAVFNVADAYYWFGKFNEADEVYKYVAENFPKSDFAMWSQMGIAISGIADANEIAADEAMENLVANYKVHPKLPEALFYIGSRYGYDKKYEKANKIYDSIISGWPESEWAKNAVYESAKLGVYSYLDKNDEPNTLKAIDRLIADFNRPELPADVFGIAARTDSANRYEPNELTRNIYGKVIEQFPQSPQAVNAQMGLSRTEIISFIDANDDPNAFAGIDKFVADYNNINSSTEEMFRISQRYYDKAMLLKYKQGRAEDANGYFYNAINVRERLIKDLPQSNVTADALFGIAVMYCQELGETEKGIRVFEELVERFPEHTGADWTHYQLGRYYNVLKSQGKIEAAIADEKIEENLTIVVERYPNCEVAPHIALQLAESGFGKGQWQQAAAYFEIYLSKFPDRFGSIILPLGQSYEKMGESETAKELYRAFIKSADSSNSNVKTVKARLETLEGQNK